MKNLLALSFLMATAAHAHTHSDTLQITTPSARITYIGKELTVDAEDLIKSAELNGISDVKVEALINLDPIFADGFEPETFNWIWLGEFASNGNEFSDYGDCIVTYQDKEALFLNCKDVH